MVFGYLEMSIGIDGTDLASQWSIVGVRIDVHHMRIADIDWRIDNQ